MYGRSTLWNILYNYLPAVEMPDRVIKVGFFDGIVLLDTTKKWRTPIKQTRDKKIRFYGDIRRCSPKEKIKTMPLSVDTQRTEWSGQINISGCSSIQNDTSNMWIRSQRRPKASYWREQILSSVEHKCYSAHQHGK